METAVTARNRKSWTDCVDGILVRSRFRSKADWREEGYGMDMRSKAAIPLLKEAMR